MSYAKSQCPVSRAEFRAHAKPYVLTCPDGTTVELDVKEFSTGSLGFYYNGKLDVYVNGHKCKCQAGLQVTLVNSKELPAARPDDVIPPAAAA